MVDAAVEGRRAGTSASTGSTVWAVLATSFGNLIEWYDVYAYSAFALYFAGSFFPKNDAAVQQLQAATLFAIAFLMRPFGSMIFGYLADRYGRRSSLTVSILAMCFGSALIAVSPTYDAIGIWAAVILSVARIIQGLSQGGEYGTSVTYLSEISPPDQPRLLFRRLVRHADRRPARRRAAAVRAAEAVPDARPAEELGLAHPLRHRGAGVALRLPHAGASARIGEVRRCGPHAPALRRAAGPELAQHAGRDRHHGRAAPRPSTPTRPTCRNT